MPETDEDGETLSAKNEIGLAGKGLVATPADDAVGAEKGGEPQFSGPVSPLNGPQP